MTSNIPKYLPSIGRLLSFANAASTTLSSRRLRKHGLTMQQWIALTALWREPVLSESELAEYCRTSPSALNRLLDRMEKKGLVRRRRDPDDRRRVLVTLGPSGEEKDTLIDFYNEINDTLLQGFTAKESREIASYLERITQNAERGAR